MSRLSYVDRKYGNAPYTKDVANLLIRGAGCRSPARPGLGGLGEGNFSLLPDHNIRHRYANGMTEGFNNKIKLIQRRAFGLRNEHNRKKRILADCART